MPRLSVVLIARNEEHNIQRAISSVTQVADEIIVTDTGSEDQTIAFAREMGAQVHEFPWCDDFAAARNHVVERASGDWILLIDADEALSPESVPLVPSLLDDPGILAYHLLRRDFVEFENPDLYTEMWQLRLFRNRPDLRFQGRCHPDFCPKAQTIAQQEGLSVRTSPIRLNHYGYIGNLKQNKLERAARLLALELGDRPGQLYYLIEYGRTLLLLNDSRAEGVLMEAAEAVAPDLDAPQAPMPLVATLFEVLLQFPSKKLPTRYNKTKIRRITAQWFPESAPLNWLLARLSFEAEDFETAETHLRTLVRMGETGEYDYHVSFNPRIIGEDALLNLGVCLVRQANLKEAENCFKKLLSMGVQVKAAKANLKTIKKLQKKYRGKGP